MYETLVRVDSNKSCWYEKADKLLKSVNETLKCDHVKATEQFFHVVLLIV